jgi:hypothetical protein
MIRGRLDADHGCSWLDGLSGSFRTLRWSTQIRTTFEFDRVNCSDAHEAGAESNGRQCSGVDLFVNLLAANEPVRRKLRHGHVRFRMLLKITYARGLSSGRSKSRHRTRESCTNRAGHYARNAFTRLRRSDQTKVCQEKNFATPVAILFNINVTSP